MISRTLETLGVGKCYVYDPNRLIRTTYGKSRTRRIRTVSSGAFFRVAFERIEDPEAFLQTLPGRKVATVPDQTAEPLTRFTFRPDDLIVFGSEGPGIQPELLALCDERVTIPQRGETQSLNLGVAVGITLFEFLRQTDSRLP